MSGMQPRSAPRSHCAHPSHRHRHLHAQSLQSQAAQDGGGAAPVAADPAPPPISSCTVARESTAMPIRTAARKYSTLASVAALLIALQAGPALLQRPLVPCPAACPRRCAAHGPHRPCHGGARSACRPEEQPANKLACLPHRKSTHPRPVQHRPHPSKALHDPLKDSQRQLPDSPNTQVQDARGLERYVWPAARAPTASRP